MIDEDWDWILADGEDIEDALAQLNGDNDD